MKLIIDIEDEALERLSTADPNLLYTAIMNGKPYEERPQGDIIKCQNCKHRIKEWREDKRMKEKGYFVYGCEVFGEIIGYWGWGGHNDAFCSEAERREE